MRRYLAIGGAAVALTYFLDPENGWRRRKELLAWLRQGGERAPRQAPASDEVPIEAAGNGRPSVDEEEATVDAFAAAEPEPVVIGAGATPAAVEEPKEAPSPVAVADRPAAATAAATLPPPLPPDLVEAPAVERGAEEPEAPTRHSRRRRGWQIGVGAVLVAALAAAALAAWSFDVFDGSDGETASAASALAALADRQARAISIMAQPGAKRIPVVGAEERLLLIVGMEGDAVLLVSRLERAPAGRAYEIWVISGGKARPAGLFRGGKDAVVPLSRAVPKGATVALTLERSTGSPRPTSEPLFAVIRS